MNDHPIPPGPARDALEAVYAALDIPRGATAGDEEKRAKILEVRLRHATVLLESILSDRPGTDVPWSVAYLRARLSECPAEGRYRTWQQAIADLDAAKGSAS